MKNTNWTREQALACFNLYCRIPFGRFHRLNREIIAFAEAIGRTPDAVAMKLSNFASFDPAHRKRKVKGLSNVSSLDRAVWREFEAAPNLVAEQSEEAFNRLALSPTLIEPEVTLPKGATEKLLSRPMRLVQSFFRRSVLASYEYRCSFCRLDVREVLNASHIIPWNACEALRADPRNGICLCALHDRAFDRGLMSINSDNTLLISERLCQEAPVPVHKVGLLDLKGTKMRQPQRFFPDSSHLEYHRTHIFIRS